MSDTFDADDFYAADEVAPIEEVEVGEAPVEDVEADLFDDSDEWPVDVDNDVDDAPAASGQGEVTDEGDAAVSDVSGSPEREYVDLASLEGKYVRVPVQGEELDVPVSELSGGWMRQEDYTRKTQEVADQRKEVEFWTQVDQAMRVNPQGTLEYLGKTYGADVASTAADNFDDWDTDTPQAEPAIDPRLQGVVEFVEQQQAERQLAGVVRELSTKYGDEFDPNAVIQEAVNRKRFNPTDLETVFKDMMFDRYRATAAAQTTATQTREQSDQQRKAAAVAASQSVSQGGSVVSGDSPRPASRAPRNAREAVLMTLSELDG